MSRMQLALNVSDLDEAITFYSTLFKTPPAKVRSGYANFAIEDPPLKLVLIEGVGEPSSTEEVMAASKSFARDGLSALIEEQTSCCYAVQDKVWVDGPDRSKWEIYTVLSHADDAEGIGGDDRCCTSASPVPVGTNVPAASSVCC
jgi:hypothetical protein